MKMVHLLQLCHDLNLLSFLEKSEEISISIYKSFETKDLEEISAAKLVLWQEINIQNQLFLVY